MSGNNVCHFLHPDMVTKPQPANLVLTGIQSESISEDIRRGMLAGLTEDLLPIMNRNGADFSAPRFIIFPSSASSWTRNP